MVLVRQDTRYPCHIVIIHEGQEMLSFVSRPFFRSELLQKTVNDFEHIHTVKAGIKSLVTHVICRAVQHAVIYEYIVIAVQQLT